MLHNVLQLVLDVCLVFLADDVTQVIAHIVQPLVLRHLQKHPQQIMSFYSLLEATHHASGIQLKCHFMMWATSATASLWAVLVTYRWLQ